jgi:integrase
MPRKVRDSNLENRTARARLKVRKKPYFRLIEPGLHLGYRRLASGPGTWLARRYAGAGAYTMENLRTAEGEIIIADDYSDADGARVLSFAQAQEKVKGPRAIQAARGYTVADALDDYLAFLESDARSKHAVYDARRRADAFIRPKLSTVKVTTLDAARLRTWRNDLAKMPARVRTRKGAAQKHREMADSPDSGRARQSSTNRTWTVFRAALNHAFKEGKVPSDLEWRKVKPFRNVDAARPRYLTIAEAKRLMNACGAEFRQLVQAALQTGARYGELCRLTVVDFNPDSGTIAVRQSKSGKPRDVVLSDEGKAFFVRLTAGRAGDAPMFSREWRASHQLRPMGEAVKRADIKPVISFHGLRHTWASLSIMNGVPLMVVAKNLGHRDTRMVEKHYGHLAESYVAQQIRKGAPRFGFEGDNVEALSR